MRRIPGKGPANARIMLVGEAPGADEELAGEPFVGAAGHQLNTQLREAGIDRNACYVTNVCQYRPPANDISVWVTDTKSKAGEGWQKKGSRWYSPEVAEGIAALRSDVARLRPQLLIGFGNIPLWGLTGKWGITDWRGSQLTVDHVGDELGDGRLESCAAFIPTLHPAAVLRQWSWRAYAIHDLKVRAAASLAGPVEPPTYAFNIRPTLDEALGALEALEPHRWVSVDLETGGGGIVCCGLAWTAHAGICLPFLSENGPYWEAHEQRRVEQALQAALERVHVVGQNSTSYDTAYFDWRLGYPLRTDFDTFIAQSVLWPGEPRDLGHLSSLYCAHHRYWKADADMPKGKPRLAAEDFDRLYYYCCEDNVRQLEVALAQDKRLTARGLQPQFASRMNYAVNHVYPMARRGLLRDPARTKAVDAAITERLHGLELQAAAHVGHPIVAKGKGASGMRSSATINNLLYRELALKPIKVKRGKGDATESGGDEAITQLLALYPQHAPLLSAILAYRSLSSLQSTFVCAKTGPDGRLRSQIAATGTETFRLTSGTDQFGGGANLLNITKDSAGINLRKLIVPNAGYVMFNTDLSRADLQPVVWEADDAQLKDALRRNMDFHLVTMCDLFDIDLPHDELVESHPQWPEHAEKYKKQRALAKRFVHLTNYGGAAKTAGRACGMSMHEADLAQRRWFAAHPGIKRWHDRTAASLRGTKSVRNAFGYVRQYLGRPESLLPEGLAWMPQSVVALVTAMIHELYDAIPGVEVQLQSYDALTGQYRVEDEARVLPAMRAAWQSVVVPYADPLVIPMGLETSLDSWGACTPRAWPV